MKTRYVTEDEFIEACKRFGVSEDLARMQLKWCRVLGSEVRIGEETLALITKDDQGSGEDLQ